MEIEFFHDVLCAWICAFSPGMRRLVEEFPEIHVMQKGFALAPHEECISHMFGSKSAGRRDTIVKDLSF